MTPAGFPHSEIHGSKRVCRSPWLIAACRVLHRRSAPRHPPFTLSSLAIKYFRRESYKNIRVRKHLLITRFWCQRPVQIPPRFARRGLGGIPATGFPQDKLVELNGLEPSTYGLQSRPSPSWATAPTLVVVGREHGGPG